ncbi:hypothetical protein ACN4EG_10740 [Alkalinema pantanalense CENA528]|uniref:hypothetical protein n=1 Tax=Alkalinema pantanalense TaxID=1620705 RepID=UPI003D6F6CC6
MLRTFSHPLSSPRSQHPSLGSFSAIVGSSFGRLYRVSVESHPAIDCRKPAMVGAIESTISRQDWVGEGRPNPRTELKTYQQCGARRRKAC